MLTAETIAAAHPGWLGKHLSVVPSTTSTNSDLVAEARAGAPHGRVLIAEAQSGGRGRVGRKWHSPAGKNLYLSLLLRPREEEVPFLPTLALVAGVAVAEGIESAARGVRPSLKWPNDILAKGRKVAGILTEATEGSPPALVVGVGLNVNEEIFPPELRPTATSLLLETRVEHDRAEVAARVLEALGRRMGQLDEESVEAALEVWRRRSSTLGQRVVAGELSGRATGIDRHGALILTDETGGIHKVVAGEISLVGAPPNGAPQ